VACPRMPWTADDAVKCAEYFQANTQKAADCDWLDCGWCRHDGLPTRLQGFLRGATVP
jgi:hypothetical protein